MEQSESDGCCKDRTYAASSEVIPSPPPGCVAWPPPSMEGHAVRQRGEVVPVTIRKIDDGKTYFDEPLLPHGAICECEEVMQANKGKARSIPWEKRSVDFHVQHALDHLTEYDHARRFGIKRADDDLAHAATRLLLALEIRRLSNGK